ncbi:MAG TPA: permease prefix domain 1-containing protein, partial [Longimicrobiales bacterium]|nr:permease prefix domain 1-containing protein [Longimicrobiales bacterium]
MSPIPGLRRYFRLPLTRATVERDVDDEVQFHIAMRIDDLVAAGCTRDEAETIAHREFGDVRAAQAELSRLGQARVRRARRADMRDVIGRDLHHGVRMLVREPGFAIAVILTLAIGLGVNAVMFGITDRLLFRAPPGVHESDDVAR